MNIISLCKHSVKVLIRKDNISFIPRKKNNFDNTIFFENINDSVLQNKNEKEFKKLVAIDGIGFSGSSALRDNAVHQFIDVCIKYYNSNIPFFDENFLELSKLFLKNICSYKKFKMVKSTGFYREGISSVQ